ncbi:MAG TPA: ATPase, partial [Euryarchaeota archaeon]|nr:ATPase [Euryarchaeota archaeon]
EYDAKRLMGKFLKDYIQGDFTYEGKVAFVGPNTDLEKLPQEHPWLESEKLVAKPDQLFGKRGKNGLLKVNADYAEVKEWISQRLNKRTTIHKKFDESGKSMDQGIEGELTHFLIEPFTPHSDEYYVAIKSERDGDVIYFSLKGGVDIESVWETDVREIHVPILSSVDEMDIAGKLIYEVKPEEKAKVEAFIKGLFKFYSELGFAYLEINPFAFTQDGVVPLDTVAKLDDTAAWENRNRWEKMDFPAPFGKNLTPEEAYIEELDSKTGASLKLTVLNPKGRVWTMVAGGGASVIYADTVADLGYGNELANYGEYSGDPNEEFTYLYAKTILDLMTREKNPEGKFLIIGGGIANFTDVAKTFKGIVRALKEFKEPLIENRVKIYVRRGGPNYKEGLNHMRKLGEDLGVPIEVYGPETPMTRVVTMALKEGA